MLAQISQLDLVFACSLPCHNNGRSCRKFCKCNKSYNSCHNNNTTLSTDCTWQLNFVRDTSIVHFCHPRLFSCILYALQAAAIITILIKTQIPLALVDCCGCTKCLRLWVRLYVGTAEVKAIAAVCRREGNKVGHILNDQCCTLYTWYTSITV